MSFGPGKNGVFKLDDGGGSLRDISAYTDDVAFPQVQGTYETTTLGNSAKAYIPGLTDATFSFGGKWDPTLDGYVAGDIGKATTTSFEYYPAGTGSGNIKYSGECIVTSYEAGAGVDAVVPWKAAAQVTGTITRTVL